MFSLNCFNLNFPFSNKVWWRTDHFSFEFNHDLKYLPLFKQSIQTYKSFDDNRELLDFYSDYYKKCYILEIINGENNVTAHIEELEDYLDGKLVNLRTKDQIKIRNLRNAVDDLYPNIFFTDLPPNNFTIELALSLNRKIGEDLFKSAGKYRLKDAMASKENFFYLEPDKIDSEMKKLFDNVCNLFFFFRINNDTENLIKLGSQFLVHFLMIHPFENGNGRVARLLLSYLLSSITVVPLSIFSRVNGREVYLDCLRDERNKSPTVESNLASLILECAYFNLEKVCIYLDIFPELE